MTREEFAHLQRAYWDAMPQWMRDAYHNEPLVYQIVQRCLHGGLPADQLASKMGEALLCAYKAAQDAYIEHLANHPDPIIIRS
jgi:hypothetical protein